MKRKPGRPKKSNDPNELSAKDRILETALRLFYRYGIHEIGVDRIIAESEVAKMTFFNHFPTKRDLVKAFLVLRDERSMKWVEATLDSITKDKDKRLPAVIEVMAMWFRGEEFRGCAFINTTVEIGPDGQEEKLLCFSHKERLMKFIELIAKEAGYRQAQKLAEQMVTIIDGATIRAQMDGPEAAVDVLKKSAKALLGTFQK